MNPLLVFILFLLLIAIPVGLLVNWLRYRGTIIFKTALIFLTTNILVALASFVIGFYGINYLIFYLIAGYLSLLIGNLLFKKYIQKPINGSIEALKKISAGYLNIEIKEELKKSKDEIGKLNNSLEELIIYLKDTAAFAKQVGHGNLNFNIKVLSDSDFLRNDLIEMREKLKEATESQEKKKIEEEKRSWANQGLAQLNEILRKQDNVQELSYQILSFLINYMGANQGGIFIRNAEDPENIILELQSFYAFDRRKYIKRTFEMGEGLVGNCAMEKQLVHLTEIPDNYIQITSGLGGSNPHSLVLVPMKMEDEVLGIIEIASFNDFEDYQIKFLEQASLSIASSLNMAETNRRTAELLEKTQQQAEEMAAQEEEMRQNMEELQATQEESTRRNQEVEKLLEQSQKQSKQIESKVVEFEKREIELTENLKAANKKIKDLEAKLKKK